MRGLVGPVFCGILLSVCSSGAFADSVSITGNVSFTTTSLTFAPPFATQADSGIFSTFSGGTVNYMLGTVPYMNNVPGTEEAFSITSGGNVLAFWDENNSPSQSYDASGNLDVVLDETGYYTFNGGQVTDGYFDVVFNGDSPTGSTSNVGFLGTGALTGPPPVFPATAITPEPGSFLLMGTGFLAMAGLVRRRRSS